MASNADNVAANFAQNTLNPITSDAVALLGVEAGRQMDGMRAFNLLGRLFDALQREQAASPAATSTSSAPTSTIHLSDALIEEIRQSAKNDGTLWMNVYHVNRVLLHALCYSPAEWTPLFREHLSQVLSCIRSGFNAPELRDNPKKLQRESYPDELLAQLDGLIHRYDHPDATPAESVLTPSLLTRADSARVLYYLRIQNVSEQLVLQLFDAGVPFDIHAENGDGVTFLDWAAALGYTTLITKLIALGADCNRAGGTLENTPLHWAAGSGHHEAMRLLLRNGATISAKNHSHLTPMDLAIRKGNPQCVELLLDHGMALNAGTGNGTPLCQAARHGHIDLVVWLLSKKADVAGALSEAAQSGCLDMVNLLLRHGAKAINPVQDAAYGGNPEVVKLFLQQGFSPDGSGEQRGTPLWIATTGGDCHVATLLLEAGADVNVPHPVGHTPLTVAIRLEHVQLIELLLNTPGIDIHAGSKINGSAMHAAIDVANQPLITRLLAWPGTDINAPGGRGGYAYLHYAVDKPGNAFVVRQLIQAGASVTQQTGYGETALHIACRRGNPDVVDVLVQAGADIHAVDSRGHTPLWYAVENNHPVLVRKLIEQGAGNAVNGLLHKAVSDGKTEAVAELLKSPHVDINAEDEEGETPVYHAIRKGKAEVLKVLLNDERINVFVRDEHGRSPLHVATLSHNEQIVDILLNHPAISRDAWVASTEERASPLHEAAMWGRAEVISRLKAAGVDITVLDTAGNSALHHALNARTAELLLKTIAVDCRNHAGDTPLHRMMHGLPKVAECLLKDGADIHAQNFKGRTPLHIAAYAYQNHGCIELAHRYGGNINAQDFQGRTPLHLAAKKTFKGEADYSNMASINTLLNLGADPCLPDNDGLTPLHLAAAHGRRDVIERLLQLDIDGNCQDRHGRSPLHWAVYNGHVNAFSALIADGRVDINRADREGKTPLHWAAFCNEEAILRLACERAVSVASSSTMSALDVNAQDLSGNTPLHWAIANNSLEAVRILMSHPDIRLNSKNRKGETPLHLAVKTDNADLIIPLVLAGADLNETNNEGQTPEEVARDSQQENSLERFYDIRCIQCLQRYRHNRNLAGDYKGLVESKGYFSQVKRFFGACDKQEKMSAVDTVIAAISAPGFDRAALQRALPPAARQGELGKLMQRYFNGESLEQEQPLLPTPTGHSAAP